MSVDRLPKAFIDKWDVTAFSTFHGFRNRRKVYLEAALETSEELIENGWKIVYFNK